MNRKEMIIAAALVNAGLLIVLFATALKTDTEGSPALVQEAKVIEKAVEVVAKNQEPVVVGGEVDRALQTLASAHNPLPAPGTEIQATASSSSFVEEIKSIATQEAPVSAPVSPAVQTLMAPLHKEANRVVEVKVKKGDVLEKIARHNHSTVQEIMKANQLTSTNLKIGQVLKVPQKESSSVIAATSVPVIPASSQVNSSSKWYEVKKGDSPWTIAVKNHVKVEDLLRLNQMTEEQARRLKPGDKIRIQ